MLVGLNIDEKGIVLKMEHQDQQNSDLPAELSEPARRALLGAGYRHLEQLTKVSTAEIKRLHGIGPKSITQLRHSLGMHGLSFADEAGQ